MDSIVLEEPSSSSSSTTTFEVEGDGGGRAIDRHNPIIRDEKRLIGQGHIFPSSSTITITSTTSKTDQAHHDDLPNITPEVDSSSDQKRKSSTVAYADADDEVINQSGDFIISQDSSSRFLLSDHNATFNFSSSSDQLSQPPPPHGPLNSHKGNAGKIKDDDDSLPSSSPPAKPPIMANNNSKASKHRDSSMFSATPRSSPYLPPPPPPPQPSPPSSHQVVVLEVSLHCRGCERKMKKHISKIEGVTSFKIEFAAKKVTVVGDVTPLAVLTSVLKVKNAKLLTPATISSS